MSLLADMAGKSSAGDLSQTSNASNASAVDLSAIEQQKENIQPLAAGRSAKTLHSLFTSDRKTLQDELKEGHERFKREIDTVEKEGADDPLDVYHRYVRWTLSSYPTGPSHSSHLVPLLEQATRRFVHEEQYKADIRLLKLWILYAKYVDCPKDIFRFLEGLQVGVKLASFYEEWAMLEEQSNNFPGADAIYTLAIARRAQPLERLKKRREAFQARMLLPRAHTPPVEAAAPSVRSVLGSSTLLSAAGQFRGTSTTNASVKTALPNNGASGFAVFKDDGRGPHATESQEVWNEFGTNASRKKENIRDAVPWKGETLPMAGTAPAVQSMRLEVFRDEDADEPTPNNENNDNEGLSLKRSLRTPGEAELLRKNPFRNYGEPVELVEIPDISSIPAIPAVSSRPAKDRDVETNISSTRASSSQTQSKSSSAASSRDKLMASQPKASTSSSTSASEKRKEKVASPLHDIYPDGFPGLEYSFEEIWAAKRQLRDLRSGKMGKKASAEDDEWRKEARHLGTSWKYDSEGRALLRDPVSGVALFAYLQEQDEAEQQAKMKKARLDKEAEEKARRIAEMEARKRQEEEKAQIEAEKRANAEEREKAKREAAECARLAREAEEAKLASEAKALEKQQEAEHAQRQKEEEQRRARKEAEERERRRILEVQRLQRKKEEEDLEQIRIQEQEQAEKQRIQRIKDEEARQARIEHEQQEQKRTAEEARKRLAKASPARAPAFNKPPSPTINTKAALAEVNAMFAKTMRFDGDQDDSDTEESSEDDDGFEQGTPLVASQAETDDTFWSHSQSQSQQPFQSQQSMPSQSTGFGGSESGETTEESDAESDFGQAQPLSQQQSQEPSSYQTMSRSSSASSVSSSSGLSFSQENKAAFKPSRPTSVPKHSQSDAIADENVHVPRPPASSRSAFKPTRTPLGAKPLATIASIPKPTFQVFSESPKPQPSTQAPQLGLSVKPQRLAIFSDENLQQEAQQAEESEQSEPEEAPGYSMGRRVAGPNRFASMMDVMTPITERTCEFGMATTTLTGYQSGEMKASTSYAEQSDGEDGFEDLASSRGSNWEAGRRQLELIEEEEELSRHERSGSGSEDRSNTSTVIGEPNASSQTVRHRSPSEDGPITLDPPRSTTSSRSPSQQQGNPSLSRIHPCDPLDPAIVDRILNNPSLPLVKLPGFRDHRTRRANKLDGLQKMAKSRRKSVGNSSRSSNAHEEVAWELTLARDAFSVREKLGEGGYGAVFRVAELSAGMEEEDEDDLTQTALKVESPGSVWEFYVLNLLHSRLAERARQSVVRAHRLYAFEDESHLLIDYCDQGSLLDAVNHAQEAGIGPIGSSSLGLEEVLAMFFTIELIRILESFHSSRFLHGDFKIDNCLIRLEDCPGGNARGWSTSYKRDGSGGWSFKGVKVIDFGRTVDLTCFEEGQTFNPTWTTDKHDCAEVRAGTPWTYQPDYFGLACIAHVLLFGKYLETDTCVDASTGQERHSIKEPLKRYHQTTMWTTFFDILLNPKLVRKDGSLPITDELAAVRGEMETWLEANSDKTGKSLKGLLKKLEIFALAGRK